MQSEQATYHLGDILANAITHGIGALLAIAGRGLPDRRIHAGHSLAGGQLLGLFRRRWCWSTSAPRSITRWCGRARGTSFTSSTTPSIYLLIAGTYTPFCLVTLRGPLGWTLFGVEWALAVAGVIFKSFAVDRFEVASALVYLAQGWFIVVAVVPLVHALGWHGLMWLGAGGVAYTLGIIFFALDRLRYFHALWHLFVLAGSIAHYFGILFYVVPARP